jgi:hypothetical protein
MHRAEARSRPPRMISNQRLIARIAKDHRHQVKRVHRLWRSRPRCESSHRWPARAGRAVRAGQAATSARREKMRMGSGPISPVAVGVAAPAASRASRSRLAQQARRSLADRFAWLMALPDSSGASARAGAAPRRADSRSCSIPLVRMRVWQMLVFSAPHAAAQPCARAALGVAGCAKSIERVRSLSI